MEAVAKLGVPKREAAFSALLCRHDNFTMSMFIGGGFAGLGAIITAIVGICLAIGPNNGDEMVAWVWEGCLIYIIAYLAFAVWLFTRSEDLVVLRTEDSRMYGYLNNTRQYWKTIQTSDNPSVVEAGRELYQDLVVLLQYDESSQHDIRTRVELLGELADEAMNERKRQQLARVAVDNRSIENAKDVLHGIKEARAELTSG